MIGPDFLSIQVSDLEASRIFYVESVGLDSGREKSAPMRLCSIPGRFHSRDPLVSKTGGSLLELADGPTGLWCLAVVRVR